MGAGIGGRSQMNDTRFASTFRRLSCCITLAAATVTTLHGQSAEDRLFDRLDRDGSGVLDRGEIERTPAARRNPRLFERLDADADGLVSREEFERARANAREAVESDGTDARPGTTMRWEVDGVERTALVRIPTLAKGERAPLVFVWHGHGGRSGGAARQFGIQGHWPEAIVVYPQGLPTPGKLTDPEGLRSGWRSEGPAATNRDLKFFDVMYEDLLGRGVVDPELVYSTGHSNGGGFTYTLLVERGERLAAIAPSSSASSRHRGRAFPKIPIFHLAGRNDTLVKMAWQQATIDHLRRIYECGDPKPWGDHPDCRIHSSPEGALLVTCVHDGTHKMPDDAGELITRFFRDHARSILADRAKIESTTSEPGASGNEAQSSPLTPPGTAEHD
jgi:polyhydroxybutyrate depolymerase